MQFWFQNGTLSEDETSTHVFIFLYSNSNDIVLCIGLFKYIL